MILIFLYFSKTILSVTGIEDRVKNYVNKTDPIKINSYEEKVNFYLLISTILLIRIYLIKIIISLFHFKKLILLICQKIKILLTKALCMIIFL